MKNRVLVVGSGFMAAEYLKVLANLNWDVVVVGRGEEKIMVLKKEFSQFTYHKGGLEGFLKNHTDLPESAINTANIDQLKSTTCLLLQSGIKNILVEKPGDIHKDGLREIAGLEVKNNAKVLIAYNRRFYSSVLTLMKEAAFDGGITSAHFEFTEWVHTIDPKQYNGEALLKWILSNSSHVIDTAFSIIGKPQILNTIVRGQNNLDWHPSGTLFVGSGVTELNIPFTYHSNWEGPGRWAIEISTRKRRFYLKPMEKLQQQLKGSVQISDFEIDDKLDIEFKPGLFLQTKNFLNKQFEGFQTVHDQVIAMEAYYRIGGYQKSEIDTI
jgi:predicted dehydrogenase